MGRRLKTRAEIWSGIKAGAREEMDDGVVLYIVMFFGSVALIIGSLHDASDNNHALLVGLITMVGSYLLYSRAKMDKRIRRIEGYCHLIQMIYGRELGIQKREV